MNRSYFLRPGRMGPGLLGTTAPAGATPYRLIFAGDSNIVGGYVPNNNKLHLRTFTTLGVNPWGYMGGKPVCQNLAISGTRIADTRGFLEALTTPLSRQYLDGDVKVLLVGTGTNDFFWSPPGTPAQLIQSYRDLVTYYEGFPNWHVLPMTTLKASGFETDINSVHNTAMAGWSGYGWGSLVDAYSAADYPDDFVDGSPGATVHVLERAHVKWSWLCAAAIQDLNLGIGALPETFMVFNDAVGATNDAAFTSVNNALVAQGEPSQSKVSNSDGVRCAIPWTTTAMRRYARDLTFQNAMKTAFGSLDPLNQLIDVITLSTSLTANLPQSDGWP